MLDEQFTEIVAAKGYDVLQVYFEAAHDEDGVPWGPRWNIHALTRWLPEQPTIIACDRTLADAMIVLLAEMP